MATIAELPADKPRSATDDPLVWIDCETLTGDAFDSPTQMTGLDPDTEVIIEIFCIITTGNLEVLDPEGLHLIIHYPKEQMDQMDDWCTTTHANSGLTAAVLASTTTPDQAADALYEYVKRFIPERRRGLLAGNSVHCDGAFLRQAPYGRVMKHLHHRILDAVVNKVPTKRGTHKAKDDILESIEEARYYRDAIFGLTFEEPANKPAKPAKQAKKDKSNSN
ncbi:hypothetical protein G7046_g5283 [Stylonectria norvegica]|nr:hypothetical protein G7046_g5283 [Stylonectria norvegica]